MVNCIAVLACTCAVQPSRDGTALGWARSQHQCSGMPQHVCKTFVNVPASTISHHALQNAPKSAIKFQHLAHKCSSFLCRAEASFWSRERAKFASLTH